MNNSNNTQIHKLKNINLNDTFNDKETVVNLVIYLIIYQRLNF